jgi:hypothetical protein
MEHPWAGAGAGVAVAAVSAAIAWLGLRYSARHPRALMVTILGGTMARLLLVAAASILLLWFTEIHKTGYAAGLIVAYLLFLALEVVLIARGAGRRGPPAEGDQPSP